MFGGYITTRPILLVYEEPQVVWEQKVPARCQGAPLLGIMARAKNPLLKH